MPSGRWDFPWRLHFAVWDRQSWATANTIHDHRPRDNGTPRLSAAAVSNRGSLQPDPCQADILKATHQRQAWFISNPHAHAARHAGGRPIHTPLARPGSVLVGERCRLKRGCGCPSLSPSLLEGPTALIIDISNISITPRSPCRQSLYDASHELARLSTPRSRPATWLALTVAYLQQHKATPYQWTRGHHHQDIVRATPSYNHFLICTYWQGPGFCLFSTPDKTVLSSHSNKHLTPETLTSSRRVQPAHSAACKRTCSFQTRRPDSSTPFSGQNYFQSTQPCHDPSRIPSSWGQSGVPKPRLTCAPS